MPALYQALLLYEIGIDVEIIKSWIFDGFGSFPIKYHFVKADLLDKSVLDPKQWRKVKVYKRVNCGLQTNDPGGVKVEIRA